MGSRNFLSQDMQFRSTPFITFAAMIAVISSPCSGFMIAEVMPAPAAMARNVALSACRLGRPNEMFEAPQVVFTPSSSRRRRIRRSAAAPAEPSAPTGMTSGSTTTSAVGMPWSAARCTIFSATAKRTSGSSEMPVSSFEIATTAAPYFLTSGSTVSRRSSSPVTELTSALPW